MEVRIQPGMLDTPEELNAGCAAILWVHNMMVRRGLISEDDQRSRYMVEAAMELSERADRIEAQ